MSKPVSTQNAPQFTLPFSQALVAGEFVYVSGQVGVDSQTKELVSEHFEEQAEQCIRNIEAILKAAGISLDHVVKIGAHLTSLSDMPKFNEVYRRYFSEPYPARTTVESGLGNYLIEIDAVAYMGSRRGEPKAGKGQ